MNSEPSGTGTATDIFVFFCQGDSILSRLIMRLSSRSHCGIGFVGSDGSDLYPWAVYFEALFGKGFQGPRSLSDLSDWAAKNPKRKIEVIYLGVEPSVAHAKFIQASEMVGKRGYAEWQLLAMWFFERMGRRWGWHVPRSTGRVVCSEAVARILAPEIDLRDPDHPGFDEVTPGSVHDAVMKYLREKMQAHGRAQSERIFDRIVGLKNPSRGLRAGQEPRTRNSPS